MKNLTLIIIALVFACGNKKSMDTRQKIIGEFLEVLNKETEVTPNILHTKYFNQNKFNDSSSSVGYHLMTIVSIKEAIQGKKKIEILPYKEAIEKKLSVYKIDDKTEDVFVIRIFEKEEISRTIYCLMNKDKIESLSVLRKSNIVIGWN
jgi:hypothetical protein